MGCKGCLVLGVAGHRGVWRPSAETAEPGGPVCQSPNRGSSAHRGSAASGRVVSREGSGLRLNSTGKPSCCALPACSVPGLRLLIYFILCMSTLAPGGPCDRAHLSRGKPLSRGRCQLPKKAGDWTARLALPPRVALTFGSLPRCRSG